MTPDAHSAQREHRRAVYSCVASLGKSHIARLAESPAVIEAEAQAFAADLAARWPETPRGSDGGLWRVCCGALWSQERRGKLKLVDQPALTAARVSLEALSVGGAGQRAPSMRTAIQMAHLFVGTPNGIRTRDLHLERVMS